MQDIAEITFMDDMRYQMTRLVMISHLLGFNLALASYFCGFGKLRWYVSTPLTFATYFLFRNLVMKNLIDKIYYPI